MLLRNREIVDIIYIKDVHCKWVTRETIGESCTGRVSAHFRINYKRSHRIRCNSMNCLLIKCTCHCDL